MAEVSEREHSDVSIEDIRSCWKVPAIAHFCSLFRSTFLLPDFEIEELEEALFLDAGVEQSDFITNLVVQLLRGIHGHKGITSEDYLKWLRSVMKEKWELGEKRVNPLNSQDVTFKLLPTLTKVEILHALCDYRLDAADVAVLKDYDGDNLRVEPLGTDRTGATYWYFYGTRLYKEDRQLTQEEKDARHKQRLKEKRKRKKERLKMIKKMKEARKKLKQKEKVKKGRTKGGAKDKKKKKKSSKTSDDESNSDMGNKQGSDTMFSSSNKNTKKGQKGKTARIEIKAETSSKHSKGTKNKGVNTSDAINQKKKKTEGKGKRKTAKGQNPKKGTSGRKQDMTCTETGTDDSKQKIATSKKKKASEIEKQQTGKETITSQNKPRTTSTSSYGRARSNVNKGKSQDGQCKVRKRKVIKSKEIISESEEDSDEDQPLKKLAKSQPSKKCIQQKANKQKPDKHKTICTPKSTTKTEEHKTNDIKSKVQIGGHDSQQLTSKKGKKQRRISAVTKKEQERTEWSGEDDVSSLASIPESSDTDSDSEDDVEPPRWHLVCHSQEDWQKLTDFFKKSKVKCEKELYRTLANDFLPEIHSLFAAKEKALRKRLQELAPRRASSRVVIMQLKREEEERLKSIEEAEQSCRRKQVEEEKREKMKLRSKLQQQHTQNEHLDENQPSKMAQSTVRKNYRRSKKSKEIKANKDSIHARLQQVYDAVSNHEDAWPFIDPVEEAYAPAYYQIIIKPMCLSIIQKKIKKKEYTTKHQFEQDMNQLFTNCLEYNGPGNEYTLMAENLKSCLEYNVELVFPKQQLDISDNDSDGDSMVTEHHVHERPPQRQSARNANSRLEKLEDKVYARLRGLSSSESSIIESQDSSRVVSDDGDDTEVDNADSGKISGGHHDEVEHHKDMQVDTEERSGDKTNFKVSTLRACDSVPTLNKDRACDTCSSKLSAVEVPQGDNQPGLRHSDVKPSPHSLSINDNGSVASINKAKDVIASAPSSSPHEPSGHAQDENTHQQEQHSTGTNKEESVQSNKDDVIACTDVDDSKELHGQHLNVHSQGMSTSKINRVKPIQNVRPYIPDSHSEEDINTLSAPHEQHAPIQQTSQGLSTVIDLNTKRPNILKPVASCSSEIPFSDQNSITMNIGLNQAVSQGNLYRPAGLGQDFQHSKQSAHSGTSSKSQKKSKSKNPPELPAPLTVKSVHKSLVQHVPAVQPLLPSSNSSLQTSNRHQEQSESARGNTFHQVGLVSQSTPLTSGEAYLYESSQKLWRPVGIDNNQSSDCLSASKSTPHLCTTSNPDQLYLDHMKLSQAGDRHPGQVNSPSGNILESLLHKRSNVSEYCQSSDISNNPMLFESTEMHVMSKKQGDIGIQEHKFLPSNVEQQKSSHENIQYLGASGQCQSDKEQHQHRSQQLVYNDKNLPTEKELKANIPPLCSHSQQINVEPHRQPVKAVAGNSFQLVGRQPENTIQHMESFVTKQQKLGSTSLYPHTISMQSRTDYTRVDYAKDSMSQIQIGYADRARGFETVVHPRNAASYLSMLTPDSRSMKEYKDHLSIQGYPGARTAYSQAHSSLYTDQLRLHASQAAGPSYGYSSGSHIRHLVPTRPTPGNLSNSAFTPHDPYTSQSAFRMQRPNQAIYPQYMSQQEADELARQRYQQHMHRSAGVGTGLTAYQAQPTHTHPDMAYYTQHGMGSSLLGSQPVGGVGTPLPYDPSLLSHSSQMPGFK